MIRASGSDVQCDMHGDELMHVGWHTVVTANLLSKVTLLFSVRSGGERQKGESSLTIAM